MTTSEIELRGKPGALITSVRVSLGPAHDVLRIWSRHGYSGQLIVQHGDGVSVAELLIGGEP